MRLSRSGPLNTLSETKICNFHPLERWWVSSSYNFMRKFPPPWWEMLSVSQSYQSVRSVSHCSWSLSHAVIKLLINLCSLIKLVDCAVSSQVSLQSFNYKDSYKLASQTLWLSHSVMKWDYQPVRESTYIQVAIR